MKNLIRSIIAFIIINTCNYVFWSLVSWNYNPGEWGWFARMIAIIIFLSSLSIIEWRKRRLG